MDAERGKEDDGGCGGRPGDQQPGGAEQGRNDGRDHAGIEAVFGRHAGDGGKGHALGQGDDGPGEAGQQVGAQRGGGHHGPPFQEGENNTLPALLPCFVRYFLHQTSACQVVPILLSV